MERPLVTLSGIKQHMVARSCIGHLPLGSSHLWKKAKRSKLLSDGTQCTSGESHQLPLVFWPISAVHFGLKWRKSVLSGLERSFFCMACPPTRAQLSPTARAFSTHLLSPGPALGAVRPRKTLSTASVSSSGARCSPSLACWPPAIVPTKERCLSIITLLPSTKNLIGAIV